MKITYLKILTGLTAMSMLLGREVHAEEWEETASAAETEAELGEALVHFKQGVEYYNAERYEEASIEFARAYELKPSYKILFNIAQAENMLKQYAAALDAYEQYLASAENDLTEERRQQVEAEIEILTHRVGKLDIKCSKAGAVVLIDGEERSAVPVTAPISVDIGKHTVEILFEHERIFYRVYKIAGGQHLVVEADRPDGESDAATAPPTTAPETTEGPVVPEPADPPRKSPKKAIGIATLSVGAAAGIAAIATGAIALSKKKSITKECVDYVCDKDEWEDDFDAVSTLGITTDVLIGIAAAGVVTGAVLLLLNAKHENSRTLGVTPSPLTGGGVLTITGRF